MKPVKAEAIAMQQMGTITAFKEPERVHPAREQRMQEVIRILLRIIIKELRKLQFHRLK